MKRSLIILSLLLLVTGCSGNQTPPQPTPTPTPTPTPSPEDPKARAARLEAGMQEWAYDHFPKFGYADRLLVRGAVSDFVRTELPRWTLKGISTEAYESNVFWADVDIESGKRRRMVSLIVRRFYPENGEPYWKAFPLDKSHPSRLYDTHDSEIKRQLDDKTSEFENYQDEHP